MNGNEFKKMSSVSLEDRKKFAKFVEQNLTDITISIWYPMLGPSDASLSRWVDEDYEE